MRDDKAGLFQLTSSYFTAGIVFDTVGRIRECAPILYWMKKQQWCKKEVIDYCNKKRWQYKEVV